MLGLAQRSQDELFHIALYNWLIQADLTDKLLEVLCSCMCNYFSRAKFQYSVFLKARSFNFHFACSTQKYLIFPAHSFTCFKVVFFNATFCFFIFQLNSPYLEEHLMHMIKQDQSKVHNMDLLWRYYEKNRNFGKAAHVLARLADMHRFLMKSYL